MGRAFRPVGLAVELFGRNAQSSDQFQPPGTQSAWPALAFCMIVNAIRERLEREPFQPFRVRASSGKAYTVRNPGLVVLLKSEVLIAEPNSDNFSLIPYLHVAGVELIGGRNSQRRQSRGE